MRKAYSLRPGPASSVICGFEAMPVTIGILASAMIFMVARCGELQCAPSIATTLASTSLLATLTPSTGLHLLSSTISSTLRPSRPPAALISSTARSTPHISHSDATDSGPVFGVQTPIRIGPCCAITGAIAVGLSLIFGVMELINFAHGELLMLGAFAMSFALPVTGLLYWPALGVAIAATMMAGLLIYELLLARLKPDEFERSILITLGLSI